MRKELSGASEPNPFIMSCTQNFHMLMYCTIYYMSIMHTKCTPHIYYIVHTELLGDGEPNIFIILTMQNCQVLVNQLYLLYHAHKIFRC